MARIGLCMIVKNESAVIERCLDSVRPLIDYALIEDTGSTDGTQEIIRAWLQRNGLPGEVIEEPWQDFAYNRSHAMARLRERKDVDYAFIIDADDELETDPGVDLDAFKAQMAADLYDLEIRHGGTRHWRPQITSNRKPFRFIGVLHEFIEAPPDPVKRESTTGIAIRIARQGARSQDPQKYQKDAALLERVLQTETDQFLRSRYTFYLAQSYRDYGNREKALEAYLARAEMGYWDQERYVALYQAANLKAELDYPSDDVLATYERATHLCPSRAEALHNASRYCRMKGRNEEGFRLAERGLALSAPTGALFAEQYVYDYGLLDELAVNGYWSGHYRASLDAGLKLLASEHVPANHRARFLANAQAAIAKLPTDPNLGSAATPDLIGQHPLAAAREFRSRLPDPTPRILVAILAKQKQDFLPLFLDCIEALDYPKSAIVLYVRTNNNTDATETILRDWIARVGHLYAAVELDAADVDVKVEQFGAHEWNVPRFQVLGHIRNVSLQRAKAHDCDFYFVADVDNFIRPCTLRELVALDLPIVSPLLRSIAPGAFYSNYHAEIDANGYYRNCDQYQWILNRWIKGAIEVPLVHCTYLIRSDVIDRLTYVDGSNRFEYVVFSDSARKSDVLQYLDNRQVYGYITFSEGHDQYVVGGLDKARELIAAAADEPLIADQQKTQSARRVAAPAARSVAELPPKTLAPVAGNDGPPPHTGRRAIRLKEFPPNTTLRFEPSEDYVRARNGRLERRVYLAQTDEHGFIRGSDSPKSSRHSIVVLGDSVVESMFLDPDQRFPARLERILRDEHGIDVTVRNGGYSGATTLHVLNTFLNKIIPLKPDVVIWMTGIVDIDAGRLPASFWTRDCWLEPLTQFDRDNQWRDMDYQTHADWTDRERLLELVCDLADTFSIELCLATTAHDRNGNIDSASEFRNQVNSVTRKIAQVCGHSFCDLEQSFSGKTGHFHDAFHLNAEGSNLAANELARIILRSERLNSCQRRSVAEGHQRSSWMDRWVRIQGAGHPLDKQNDEFDDNLTYVINLDESEERLERFLANNSHVNFTRFAAASGRSLDRDELVRAGIIEKDLSYGRGALGCAVSHIQLWTIAAERNRVITVIEDDVVLSADFTKAKREFISSINSKWDLILWGFVFDPLFAWVDFGFASAELRFYNRKMVDTIHLASSEKQIRAPMKLLHAFGTQSYTITPEGARTLLETLLPLKNTPVAFEHTTIVNKNEGIDTAMCAVYPQMNGLVCMPPLAFQQDFGVSIRESLL